MNYKYKEADAPNRGKVKLLTDTFEKGKPFGETNGRWRQKMLSRQDMLNYIKSAERYWYSEEWYGSEKRKTKA